RPQGAQGLGRRAQGRLQGASRRGVAVAEPRTHVQATAAKIGNGAHVLVPKDWLGKEVLCIPKDQLVALIANLHGGPARSPPARLVAGGSLAYTRTPEGWQVVGLASRETKAATVWSAEHGWRPLQAKRLRGELVLEDGDALLPLPPAQAAWLGALLDAEGIAAGDL